MIPKEIERLKSRIADIKKAFASEKLCYGMYPDKQGLRYQPTKYYIQLGDYTGGLTYLNWFSKNFPNDRGLPFFLFEWIIILFKKGNIKKAEKKVFGTFCSNTYLFDKFFGRPIIPIDKWENSNLENAAFAKHLGYTSNQIELTDFSEWLTLFMSSERFTKLANKYIDIQIKLLNENDQETRHSLEMQAAQLKR